MKFPSGSCDGGKTEVFTQVVARATGDGADVGADGGSGRLMMSLRRTLRSLQLE